MDTCQIRPGLYQFTAIDDCSRFWRPVWRSAGRPPGHSLFWTGFWKRCHLRSKRLQTDRGTEFFAEAVQRRRLMAGGHSVPSHSSTIATSERQGRTRSADDAGGILGSHRPTGSGRRTAARAMGSPLQLASATPESLGGLAPIERVCALVDETPLWADVSAAYDPDNERIRVRDYAVETSLRALKGCM